MFKKINQIKVNIVLPNYNSGEIILETLDSILSQTFKNWQLIIVDDNSKETIVDKMKSILNHELKGSDIKYSITNVQKDKLALPC